MNGWNHSESGALEIEINRALYLDEATFQRTAQFDGLAADLTRLMARAMTDLPRLLGGRAAAE